MAKQVYIKTILVNMLIIATYRIPAYFGIRKNN
jgi:hypothetical protein